MHLELPAGVGWAEQTPSKIKKGERKKDAD
jgi:hypothetical protein